MRGAALVLFAIACGGPKAAAPARPVEPSPGPVARPRAVTCHDVGVILRGTVDEAPAGAQKEKVIATACSEDRWPEPVVQCIGGQTRAGSCVDGLTEEQKASYGKRLAAWGTAHPNESFDRELTGWEPPPPPRQWTCNDPLGDPALYAPEVTATGADRDFILTLRKDAIFILCNTGWEQEVLRCLQDSPAEACRTKLTPDHQRALTDELAKVDGLAAKTFTARKKPADIECKKVVATHYADAAWTGKLTDYKPADRTKAIAESRTLMTKACADEKWTDLRRACIVALGRAYHACFAPTGAEVRWGFPAFAVAFNTGIAECDVMLVHIQAMAACDKAPQQLKDAYQQSSAQMFEMYKNMSPDARVNAPSQCKQIDEAIDAAAKSLGCTL
jgi:hypothetical protein